MAAELSEQQRCGLTAAGVAGALAAEEDEGAVEAGAEGEGGKGREDGFDGLGEGGGGDGEGVGCGDR